MCTAAGWRFLPMFILAASEAASYLPCPAALTRTHFDVDGWNGIYMAFTANCWARNVSCYRLSSEFLSRYRLQAGATGRGRSGPSTVSFAGGPD